MIGKSGSWILLGALFLQGCVEPAPSPAPLAPDCSTLRCVALTLDGGPDGNTAKILDILAQNRAKVTFFVIGSQVSKAPELVKRMVDEGHEVGNHGWSHVPFPSLTELQIRAELANTNQAIFDASGGYEVQIFRPPYGSYSPRVAAIVSYNPVLWNLDPNDWEGGRSAEISRQVGMAQPGTIVLMHSFVAASVRALPDIIQQLRARGITLVTVSELLRSGRSRPALP
ncbi:MAG: polysaccharide deacetylase family protein [Rhodobacteraceae bacterium]|nr:polysaccharide deacetylase family protein [Paracoccaceae bacterium]